MSYIVICPSCRERNPGSLMTCPKCQTSLVGLPREEYPFVHSKPLLPEATPLPKPNKPREESLVTKLLLLLAKTFGIACILGIIVSALGWKYLAWNSIRQFSDGLFWTGGALAVLGYYVYRSESTKQRVMLATLYVQPSDNISMQNRLQGWAANVASTYGLFVQFILVTLFLFGFSILIWSLL